MDMFIGIYQLNIWLTINVYNIYIFTSQVSNGNSTSANFYIQFKQVFKTQLCYCDPGLSLKRLNRYFKLV